MLDLATFANLVGTEVGVDLSMATPDSTLADLGLDSLCMIQVLVMLDDRGVTLPEDLIPELTTMGDLHHYFTVLAPSVPEASPAVPTDAVAS